MFYRDILDTISFFNVDLFYRSHNQNNDNYVHKDTFSQLTNLSHWLSRVVTHRYPSANHVRPASPPCVPSRRMKCLNVKAQQVVSAHLRGAEYLVSSRTLLFKHYAPAGCRIIVINATRLLKYRWHFAVRSLTRTINIVYSNTTRGRPGLSSPKARGKGLNEQLCDNIYFTLWCGEKCSLVFRSDLRVNNCACYINSLCNLPVRIVAVLWNIIL